MDWFNDQMNKEINRLIIETDGMQKHTDMIANAIKAYNNKLQRGLENIWHSE